MSITTLDEGRFLDVNDRFRRLLGYEGETMRGRTALELGLWADPARRDAMVAALRQDGRVSDWEIEIRTRAGEVRVARLAAEVMVLDGEPCVLAVTEDITDRRRMEEELRVTREQLLRGTFYDPLTGLPNRALFLDRLERACARVRRHPTTSPAVLVVDLDR